MHLDALSEPLTAVNNLKCVTYKQQCAGSNGFVRSEEKQKIFRDPVLLTWINFHPCMDK